MSDTASSPKLVIGDKVMIEMKGVHKWYGQFHVLKNINLTVQQGERIVLCGPSGSGKSTTIRCLNRLEVHQQVQDLIRDRAAEEVAAVRRVEQLHHLLEDAAVVHARVHRADPARLVVVHARARREARPERQQLRLALAGDARRPVGLRSAVAYRHQIVVAEEHVRLAIGGGFGRVIPARRAQHEEQRIAVAFHLRALVGLVCVLDRQVMQSKSHMSNVVSARSIPFSIVAMMDGATDFST